MAPLRTVGDLLDDLEPILAGASEAEVEHVTRRARQAAGGLSHGVELAFAVVKMRAALKATLRGPETASEARATTGARQGGGTMSKKSLTGSSGLVMESIRTVARHIKRQGESDDESFLRACSEQPSLYRQYNDARLREAKEGIPPVRPTKAEGVEPDPLIAERQELEGEILRAAEACGQDFETFCAGDGRADYAVLDMMIKRTMSRAKAVRFLGKE